MRRISCHSLIFWLFYVGFGIYFIITGAFQDYLVNVISSLVFLYLSIAVLDQYQQQQNEEVALLNSAKALCKIVEFSSDNGKRYQALHDLSINYRTGSYIKLKSNIMQGITIRNLNLSDSNQNLHFPTVDMENSEFVDCVLPNIVFSDCFMKKAKFSNSKLERASFSLSNLYEADFQKTNLVNSKFVNCQLTGADFRGATLTGADFRGATLSGADFRGATLAGADLTGAILAGADLTGADLTGADLTSATLVEVGFGPVCIDENTIFPNGESKNSDWKDLKILIDADYRRSLPQAFSLRNKIKSDID